MASQAAQCTAQHIPTTSSIGKSEGKRPSRNPKLIWEGNITMILEESGRVKSGFKQYRLQPSARSFVGRRASSAAAELPFFFFSRGLFFSYVFVTTVLRNRHKLQHSFLRSEDTGNNNHISTWDHHGYFTLYGNISLAP